VNVLQRPVVVHVGVAVGSALALVAVLSATGHPLRPSWFVAVALASAAISLAWRELGSRVIESRWPQREDEAPRWRTTESRVQFVSTWIQESTRSPDVYRHRIRPVLATIVASRLRHGHGIDLDFEPDAARAVTGEWLWEMVTGKQDRVMTYGELTRLVDEVEGL
jgi:hypothetical protein